MSERTPDRGRRVGVARRSSGAFGDAPAGVVVGARPGQPHRRAHRLQRRPRACRSPCRSGPMPPCPVAMTASLRMASAAAGRRRRGRPRRHLARAARRLGRLRRGRALGAAHATACDVGGLDVARRLDRAARRGPLELGGPRVRGRRGGERPLRPRPARLGRGPRPARRALRRGRERHRRRPDRRHGPVGLAALRRGRRPAARLPVGRDASRCPSTSTRAGYALLVTDTRAEHALVDGQYAARRDACEAAAARPRRRDAARDRPRRPRRRAGAARTPTRCGAGCATSSPRSSASRSPCAAARARRPRRGRAALRRLARLAARRLRGVVRGARRRDGDGPRRTAPSGARMTGGGFGGSCIAIVRAVRRRRAWPRRSRRPSRREGFTPPRCRFTVTAVGLAHPPRTDAPLEGLARPH